MKTKYTEYKIQDLVDLAIIEKPMDGNHGEIHPKGDDFISKGIPFIMSSDINNGIVDFKNCKFISEEQSKTLRKGFSIKGDVLLTHKASIGRTAIVPVIDTDYIVLTPQVTYYRIKDSKKLNNAYLKYHFDSKSFQSVLAAFSGAGSTRAYIGITEQLNLPIRLPDINIQKNIASVLSSLDSKIELNIKINAELEAMAKTIYDYWFVQFDFPNAKGKPYKTSGGKMVWNEELKREIPEGWEVEVLNNIVSNILDHRGKTPLKLGGDWVNKGDGVIALSAKHVKDGKLVKLEEANIVGFEMYEKWMPEKLKEGDIIMTSEAPLGEFYFILNDTNYCMSQRIFAIRADGIKVLPSYLYYELSKGNGYSQIIGKASGSTVFGIRQDELRKVNVLKPKFELQKTFDEKVKPMLYQIRNNEFQNQQLASLRDWLLPMLMNGQVKVRDAEKMVEEKLSMAAEPEAVYQKNNIIKLPIPETKKSFAKQVLAGKIVSLFREDKNFTDIKFQKLQYLAEHIANADLDWNYFRKMAGPYDNKFMHTVATKLKTNKWFEDRKQKFKPLAKANDIDKYYQTYFSPAETKLNNLFNLLKNASEAHSEVIATVYAIWNNLLIAGEKPTNDKIVKLFFDWSTRKETYTEKQIVGTIKWIKDKEFEPTGFGYLIKEVNGK